MPKYLNISVFPEQLLDKEYFKRTIVKQLRVKPSEVSEYKIVRKSIDARKKVKYSLRLAVALGKQKLTEENISFDFKNVGNSKKIIIVGAGPAGYFAALQCIIKGLKPIVIERGKAVENRKKDIALINTNQELNPESNYVFGEGGAGTYSDGKLYTRSKKRGRLDEVLKMLVYFGASEDILIDSQPHIGTDKLLAIVKNIRDKILQCGGEVHFEAKVSELLIEDNKVLGVKTSCGKEFFAEEVILATGHSARDAYYFLDNQGISLEPKGIAIGVRVEHPQEMVDKHQYNSENPHKNLPPANYKIVKQINNRGVYSFCMCPGGIIVPAASNKNEIVVNGMSNSMRNSGFANSGVVVELNPDDYEEYKEYGKFAGIEFQKNIEKLAYLNSGQGLKAPGQRLIDFVKGRLSSNLPASTYNPGLISSPIHFWLPDIISNSLQKAFKEFNKSLKFFMSEEALVVGVESRTSSPLKVLRCPDSFESLDVKGLYPCGEGAGYAGGIVSAALDGINTVNSIFGKSHE